MLRLRVQDVDFARRQILMQTGKGVRDGVPMLPESLHLELPAHLQKWRLAHQRERAVQPGEISLLPAVEHKYPSATKFCNQIFVRPRQKSFLP